MKHCWTESPIGQLLLVADNAGMHRIAFASEEGARSAPDDSEVDSVAFDEIREALTAYFSGEARVFDLALAPRVTAFQRQVLDALAEVPYGETRSYGELARAIGRPRASRAVGAALGRNPLPIVVPCHRVVGADGALTGFGGGIARKRWLLAHEAQWAARESAPDGWARRAS